MTAQTDYRQPGNPLDELTETLHLPLPHWLNDSHDDVLRLRTALVLLDAACLALSSGKADKTALQALTRQVADDLLAQQSFFTNALDNGLGAANQQIAALSQSLAAKRFDLQAVAAASTTAQARAGAVALRRMRQAHINTTNTPAGTLEAGVEYSVYADAWSDGWLLPEQPTVGDQIVLLDAWDTWRLRAFKVRRANAAHWVNNVKEDVHFNIPAARVTFTYAYADRWVLSIG